MKKIVYSPHAPDDYKAPVKDACVVSVIQLMEHYEAIWNFLWLSVPQVDLLLDKRNENWVKGAAVLGRVANVLVRDVSADDELRDKLSLHPDKFLGWFQSEDPTIFDAYEVFGSQWAETVMRRADEAAHRLLRPRPVVRVQGGVLHVDFRQALA